MAQYILFIILILLYAYSALFDWQSCASRNAFFGMQLLRDEGHIFMLQMTILWEIHLADNSQINYIILIKIRRC